MNEDGASRLLHVSLFVGNISLSTVRTSDFSYSSCGNRIVSRGSNGMFNLTVRSGSINTDNSAKLDANLQHITYNPCSPLLSIPTEVYNLDPAWAICTAGITGIWDPSRVLTPASGPLVSSPSTILRAGKVSAPPAAPASAIDPVRLPAITSVKATADHS